MAIFDILEEVGEKNILKTETGDNRIFGVVVGEVVSNWSEDMPGRVCVSIHTRDNEANVLKWARVAMLSGGTDWGHYFLPEVGDQVLVTFEQGIIDRPYVIGCIQKTKDAFLKASKHKNNQHKRIVTKHGSAIEFEDVESEDPSSEPGSEDVIKIHTAGEAHKVIMDNKKKQIYIADKDKNAEITMGTQRGDITIHAAKKLTIKVGDKVNIVLNGESGKVTINAQDVSVDTTGKLKMACSGKMDLSAASMNQQADGMFKINATGMFSAQGQTMKLG